MNKNSNNKIYFSDILKKKKVVSMDKKRTVIKKT